MFTIESDVPLPSPNVRVDYPFDQMNIGDSIAFPWSQRYVVQDAIQVYLQNKKGASFEARRMPSKDQRYDFRVWRF